MSRIRSSCFAVVLIASFAVAATGQAPSVSSTSSNFSIHDGDHVVFYGDSITEQRLYTEYVEEYLLTRFPHWKVTFRNAGVGGDKVSGGWAGPIDLRLDRDVLAERPEVVTIMLGMNDGYYRPTEPGIVSTYADGLRHIVDSMQKALPQARITLIQPSPFDDVTRETQFAGGYNEALLKFSDVVANLAREKNLTIADFNTPVAAFLKTLNQNSPDLAPQLLPDRVHPADGGHWIMAEALLKSWSAPSLISSVTIAAVSKSGAEAENARVTDLRRVRGKLSWTQLDEALPLPFSPAEVDPVVALTIKLSDMVAALDQEMLLIRGLPTGNYDLLIDDRKIASLSSEEMSAGINLATVETPMLEQSRLVAADTEKKNALEAARFKIIGMGLASPEATKTAAALAHALPGAEARQRVDAQPRPHRFEIVPHL